MLIDVSDTNTFPKELEEIVVEKLSGFTPAIISKIKANNIEYETDIHIAIEPYLAPNTYREEALYRSIVGLIDKYEFVLFHATKVINKSSLSNGLRTNEWETYSTLMVSNCEILGMNDTDIQKIMSLIKEEYERKYSHVETKPNLCFFSGMEQFYFEGCGYDQFCENIGGELAKWALENDYMLYKPLKEAGDPFIVKFKMPFSDVIEIHKKVIVYELICYYAAKLFFGFTYNIRFDSMTTKNISVENILEIIPYSLK